SSYLARRTKPQRTASLRRCIGFLIRRYPKGFSDSGAIFSAKFTQTLFHQALSIRIIPNQRLSDYRRTISHGGFKVDGFDKLRVFKIQGFGEAGKMIVNHSTGVIE